MKLFLTLKARTINGLGGQEWNAKTYEVNSDYDIDKAKRDFAIQYNTELDKIQIEKGETTT